MRLIINGLQMDTFAGTDIAQTKQTNDLLSIETKQTNYTNQFDLPMTPTNVANMKYLSLVGNTSDIPYKKNECYLYSQAEDCFIYKGWALIKESSRVYKCYVYDGNLELYKAIENFKLKDLNLDELTHVKDLATVIASFTNYEYRYILADYGGKTRFEIGGGFSINIDYLVPWVRVKYLWDRLFDTFGFTYSGSVFQTQEFINFWMSFPKGLNTADADVLVYESDDHDFERQIIEYGLFGRHIAAYYAKAVTFDAINVTVLSGGLHIRVNETGTYRIDISGTIQKLNEWDWPTSKIYIGKNSQGQQPNDVIPIGSIFGIESGEAFDGSAILELNQYDSISIVIKRDGGASDQYYQINMASSTLTVELNKVNPNIIDFGEALIDFSATDFVKEVINKFGLSMFKDKYEPHYYFLTMKERIENADIDNWSKKYDRTLSENYVYGSYSQQNILKHKYSEEDQAYNDGTILIDNVNLDDQKELFQSKIYTPEKDAVDYFGRQTKVYKLFDKEFNDDGTITYKALDKRFFFTRSFDHSFGLDVAIGSEQLEEYATVPGAPMELYWKLAYKDVVDAYYPSILSLLNRAKVLRILAALTAVDVAKIDFRRNVHIEQLSANFLVNKISGYRPGNKTIVEIVQISKTFASLSAPRISFGFGLTEKTITLGESVTVWLDTVYNPGTVSIEMDITTKTKVSDYQYTVTPDAVGLLEITLEVSFLDSSKGDSVTSNSIFLTVEEA